MQHELPDLLRVARSLAQAFVRLGGQVDDAGVADIGEGLGDSPDGATDAAADPAPDTPAVLYEPRLGYLGAVRPRCRRFHLDRQVYARERSGVLTLSLLGRRRLTLLDVVPPAADSVRVERWRTSSQSPDASTG